jgi:polyisoprenoid-binding protein YceI
VSVSTSEVLPATGNWRIDPIHSTASFRLRAHGVSTFRASFTNIGGVYDADANRLAGEVRAEDLMLTGALERVKTHLLGEAFFRADEFPTFSFESTAVSSEGDELLVEGGLTIRGITKPVTATGVCRGPQIVTRSDGSSSERLGIDLTTTIDRRTFGIDFNNELAPGVVNLAWEVSIEATLELALDVPST